MVDEIDVADGRLGEEMVPAHSDENLDHVLDVTDLLPNGDLDGVEYAIVGVLLLGFEEAAGFLAWDLVVVHMDTLEAGWEVVGSHLDDVGVDTWDVLALVVVAE